MVIDAFVLLQHTLSVMSDALHALVWLSLGAHISHSSEDSAKHAGCLVAVVTVVTVHCTVVTFHPDLSRLGFAGST